MVVFWGLVGLMACVDVEGGERSEPEICDDGIDNDGDNLIDCDDTDSCGGIQCREGQGPDTGASEAPIEIVIDQRRCCDFTFNASNCDNRSAGTFDVINRTDSQGRVDLVRCERLDNDVGIPIGFRADPLATPDDSLSGVPVPAMSTVTIEAVFDCQTSEPFAVSCEAEVSAGTLGDQRGFPVRGTLF